MPERDPIDVLEGLIDAPVDPDVSFGERLLYDMLSTLETYAAAMTSAPILESVEEESTPLLDLLSKSDERTDNMNRTRILTGVLLAAAAIAVIVGALVSLDGDDELQSVPAATTEAMAPTTAAPATPIVPVFGPKEGLAAAEAYFAANSAGDFSTVKEHFTADAKVTGDGVSIAGDELLFAWNVGQGTTITEPDCAVTDELPAESVTVRCTYFNRDALVQAVDGPQVPITTTLTVTPNGISSEAGFFGQPDFNAVAFPFEKWMNENHSEDLDKVGFIEWDSVEQAEAYGKLRAEYALEWASHLEANGCTYLDGAC